MVQGFVYLRLLSGILHDGAEDVYALVNAQNAGIQGDVIVLRLAPGTAGVVLIVDTAALILFMQTLLRALVGLTVTADDALGTIGDIRKDVNMERILTVLQNIVRVTADDDTGAFLGQLQDHTDGFIWNMEFYVWLL